MERKICSKCKEEKEICEFNSHKQKKDGLYPSCKECGKNHYNQNKELILNRNKIWRTNNFEIKKKIDETYRKNNPQQRKISDKKYREIHLKKIKLRNINWQLQNPNYYSNYEKTRKNVDPIFKLTKNIRSRFYKFLLNTNITKKNKTFDIVGCSPQFLKEYLEQKFTEGMSWELMGQHIHIDHIIPLSSATTEEEVYKLCHYTNLQPLWAKDNLSKGNKIL
jgi:hypothetical protein